MSFKIGNIQIDNPVVVAPMAGISNSAFRVTVKEFGAGLVVCEMISDKGIQFRNEKTLSMLHIEPNEYPLSVQIMGGNKDTLVEAAKYVAENTEAAIIDINMGCPVNKVIKAEAGAKWLLDPNKVYEISAIAFWIFTFKTCLKDRRIIANTINPPISKLICLKRANLKYENIFFEFS